MEALSIYWFDLICKLLCATLHKFNAPQFSFIYNVWHCVRRITFPLRNIFRMRRTIISYRQKSLRIKFLSNTNILMYEAAFLFTGSSLHAMPTVYARAEGNHISVCSGLLFGTSDNKVVSANVSWSPSRAYNHNLHPLSKCYFLGLCYSWLQRESADNWTMAGELKASLGTSGSSLESWTPE